MKQIRSFLFVPGNKPTWIEKAREAGADALILDLEDSVPETEKDIAREAVGSRIEALAKAGVRVYVRINKGAFIYSFKDLCAVIRPGLEGVIIPKPEGIEDVDLAHRMIAEAETDKGLPIGSIGLLPTLETAKALQSAYQIACHSRVTFILCASARNGDVQRSVGYQWTKEGLESLHFKSAAVIAARAAGKQPIAGLWQDVQDLEGFDSSVALHRQLGFSGELLIHPLHVERANAAYSPSAQDLAYYHGMVEAYEAAKAQGRGAVIYQGEHIDSAHYRTACSILEIHDAADSIGQVNHQSRLNEEHRDD